MEPGDEYVSQRFAASLRGVVLACTAVITMSVLQGCGSPPRLTEAMPVTRTHVSLAEIRQIKFGMSPYKVKDVLGKPLNVVDLDQRYDYLVKVAGENKQVRFAPYGVFFRNGVVAKVEALDK